MKGKRKKKKRKHKRKKRKIKKTQEKEEEDEGEEEEEDLPSCSVMAGRPVARKRREGHCCSERPQRPPPTDSGVMYF